MKESFNAIATTFMVGGILWIVASLLFMWLWNSIIVTAINIAEPIDPVTALFLLPVFLAFVPPRVIKKAE